MSDCQFVAKCIFFNDKMANMPSTAEMLKKKYCRSDFEHCARFMVATRLGRDKVPSDLTPSQMDRANVLLA